MAFQTVVTTEKSSEFKSGSGTRAYASIENLNKGLKKFGIDEYHHLVVKTVDGKFTAIFAASEATKHGYIGVFSQYGFMTFRLRYLTKRGLGGAFGRLLPL